MQNTEFGGMMSNPIYRSWKPEDLNSLLKQITKAVLEEGVVNSV